MLAQPSQAPGLRGLGRHLPGFLQETSCSGPSPGQRGTIFEAQTFLSLGLRPEQQLTRGRRGGATFQPGCSGWAAGCTAGSAQESLGRDQRKGRRGPVGLCWTQACAKCRLPGQQENIRWGRESQTGVWVGSEVLAPGRRPPAGLPGHREGIAEALSSQRATVAGFWG